MFKLRQIEIQGFWQSRTARADLRDDVNIIIGKNGTGKTTFMNIAHAVLTVDIDALSDNAFRSVTLKLSDGKRKRTIRADRREMENAPFSLIEYHISNKRFATPLIGGDEGRMMSPSARRRALEEAQKIKLQLASFVAVASLSVHRIGSVSDPDLRERPSRVYMSTVDVRLQSLMQRLTQYQLELSNSARDISAELQKDVLTSLLYDESSARDHGYKLDFDEVVERQNLVSAYRQLGVGGAEVAKKIQEHLAAVGRTVKNLRQLSEKRDRGDQTVANIPVDFAALEAFKLTSKVVAKSLTAEKKTKDIFSQVDLFLRTLKTFIEDKMFSFAAGELVVQTAGSIPLAKLSSGEKQLLILFIEALLQRRRPYIFLADEPELSLHIAWQRNIISAIRAINPNAQIIVATHSPEIAGKFRPAILDMEDILHA